MQRIIRGKIYDTEIADKVSTRASGAFGDPAGFEERLYRTPDGWYFLYGIGGEESPYPTPVIRAVSKKRAAEW